MSAATATAAVLGLVSAALCVVFRGQVAFAAPERTPTHAYGAAPDAARNAGVRTRP